MLEVLLAVVGAARLSEGGFCSSSVRRVLDFGLGFRAVGAGFHDFRYRAFSDSVVLGFCVVWLPSIGA